MTDWSFVLGPASGGHAAALTQVTARKMTFRLAPPHEASCQVNGRALEPDAIIPLATDLHILRDQTLLYRGRIGRLRDTGNDKEMRTDITSACYRELLKRRRLYTGDTVTFAAVEQAEIAWLLINASQVRTAGQLGITKGITPTGQVRDRTYTVRDSIGELIQQLSEVEDGFDWDISPASASALKLDVFSPVRGSDRKVVLEFGGLVAEYVREVDVAAYANAIQITGDESVEPALNPEVREADDLADAALRPEGRWDGVAGYDIKTQEALAERAGWQILESQVIPVIWTLALRPGAWQGPGHIWVGDTVQVVVNDGHLATDQQYRVHEIDIALDGSDNETVTIVAGGTRPSFRRRASHILRRLTELERR